MNLNILTNDPKFIFTTILFNLLFNDKNYSELISTNNCIFQFHNDKLAQNHEKGFDTIADQPTQASRSN